MKQARAWLADRAFQTPLFVSSPPLFPSRRLLFPRLRLLLYQPFGNEQLNYIYQSDYHCQLSHFQSALEVGALTPHSPSHPLQAASPWLSSAEPPAFIRVFSPSTHQASPFLLLIHRSAVSGSEQGFLFFSSFLSFSLLCRPRQSKSREPSSHPDRVKLVFGLLYLPLFIFRFLKFPHSPLVESHSFLQSYIPGTHPGKVRIRYIKPKKKQARYTRQIAFQASMDRSCAPQL